jgi:ATP-binding cassette subfamily B protein
MGKEFKKIIASAIRVAKTLERRQKLAFSSAVLLMAITAALNSVPAIVLGRLVDFMFAGNSLVFGQTTPFIAIIILAILAREALQVLRKYLVENTCTRIEKNNTVELINHLLRLDISYFSTQKVGALHGRLHRSIEGLVRLLKLCFLDFFPALLTSSVAFVVAISHSPLIGAFMGLVMPVGLAIVLRQITTQKGIRIDLLRKKEEIDGTVVELLGGIETVRAANTVNFETAKVERIAEGLRQKEIQHHLSMAFYDCFKYLNEGGFHILILCLSIFFATQGMISKGDILTFSMLFYSVVNPLREIHRILDEAHESSIKVEDFFALKDLPVDLSFMASPYSLRIGQFNEKMPMIEIEQLFFDYSNSQSNGKVLDGVDLIIMPGERIGVAGASGCGKSTLLKILLRILHYQRGKIFIAGQPLPEMSREAIARMIGYVSQTPFLFSGTITDNIAYGSDHCDMADIIAATKLANIHEEILRMPGGYLASVAERGSNLSGGQRQRIALARMFLQKPAILILDEATAALDNLNEKVVQENIETNMNGRTIITVAHRLTTLRNCDRIYAFDKGQIVENGSYDELLRQKGAFAQLAKSSSTF